MKKIIRVFSIVIVCSLWRVAVATNINSFKTLGLDVDKELIASKTLFAQNEPNGDHNKSNAQVDSNLPQINLPTVSPAASPLPASQEPAAAASPVAHANEAVSPTVSPVAPANRVVSPAVSPSAHANGAVSPAVSPSAHANGAVSPAVSPVAPANEAVSPAVSPVAPANRVVSPTVSPVAPANRVVSPTVSPVASPLPASQEPAAAVSPVVPASQGPASAASYNKKHQKTKGGNKKVAYHDLEFEKREIDFLFAPDDDVVNGKLTFDAYIDRMDYYEYIQLFKLNYVSEEEKIRADHIRNYLKHYHDFKKRNK